MKKLVFLSLFILQFGYAQNYQTVEQVDEVCSQLGFTSDQEAQIAVDLILDEIGIASKSFKLRSCPNINNAVAKNIKTSDGVFERYILYDLEFMERISENAQNDWSAISVLAHEIGHHLSGHALNNKGSNHAWELEADFFSGVALAKMGSTLDEAQSAINTLRYEKATSTHPAKKDRLQTIEEGWIKGGGKSTTVVTRIEDKTLVEPVDAAFEAFVQTTISEYNEESSEAFTPAPSPFCVYVHQQGDTKFTIKYSRLSMRGRNIFGDLYKYGELWRTGANKNTIFSISEDVFIDEKLLKAGAYALYTIPGKVYWTVLFYKNTDNWGTPKTWDNEEVALSVKIRSDPITKSLETFSITIEPLNEVDSFLNIMYENTQVKVPVSIKNTEIETSLATAVFQKVGLTQFELLYQNALKKNSQGAFIVANKLKFDDDVEFCNTKVRRGTYLLVGSVAANGNLSLELEAIGKTFRRSGTIKDTRIALCTLKGERLTESNGPLQLGFADLSDNSATLLITSSDFEYKLLLVVPTLEKVISNIESLMAINAATESTYYAAAVYYHDNDLDINKAKEWIDTAIEKKENPAFWFFHQQALIYYKAGYKSEAIEIARKTMKLAQEAGNDHYVKMNLGSINEWSSEN